MDPTLKNYMVLFLGRQTVATQITTRGGGGMGAKTDAQWAQRQGLLGVEVCTNGMPEVDGQCSWRK